ncbi:MAG: PIG-L family deacetylase [bacterium]|nr:PIG-L family deacetylase [bacterium]
MALEKLLTLGTVLYVAAHPDDENTRVLAYFSLGRKMRAGYLAVTRGGGGQNLIGTEKGPVLSALRTHELLEARHFDGTEQFFTRGVDFGYSKSAEETMSIWGKEKILEDMVFVVRKFRPDVILTRFPTDGRGGHGHHVASALLAVEAFKAAGDASRFPEQLKEVSVWQPKRVFWNSWVGFFRDAKPEDLAKLIGYDVGAYNPLLGKSYAEVSALSRSQHKSQGFGMVARRGEVKDYFDLLAGEPAKTDVLEGVDTTWNRVPGSEKVRKLLEKANDSYQAAHPHKSLPVLLEALTAMKALPDSYWRTQKLKELKEVIRSCAGIWIEAITEGNEVTPGQVVKVKTAVVNRSDFPITIKKIIVPGKNSVLDIQAPLKMNKAFRKEIGMKISEDQYTHSFWLREAPEKGLYPSGNHRLKGRAIAPYPFTIQVVFNADGTEVTLDAPVLYRWRDPVKGERIRHLAVTPPVTLTFTEKVFYFPTKEPQRIDMILRSGPAAAAGTLKLNLPSSWKVKPAQIAFDIPQPLTEKKVSVTITPPNQNTAAQVTADLVVDGVTYRHGRLTIEYDHLPLLTLHPKAEARLIRVDIKRKGSRIGYVMGAGDDIPKYLEQVGYKVDILSDDDLRDLDLSIFDAIITGVRAYNTRDILKHVQKRLLDYVAAGGRLVVQYNTNRGLKTTDIGPYSINLSRQRVTEEDAKITFTSADHPLLKGPNAITAEDFNGWVQERGLYFADKWDPKYSAPLAGNDIKQKSQKGGLLYAQHGKGTFVYTGYSFFRQLPQGVGGALKLFVNMISTDKSITNLVKKENQP